MMPLDAELIALAWRCEASSDRDREAIATLARKAAREIQRQRREIEALERRLETVRDTQAVSC
jgi:hypothetical protein